MSSSTPSSPLALSLPEAFQAAGLQVLSATPQTGGHGQPTVRIELARADSPDRRLSLELSQNFAPAAPGLAEGLDTYLQAVEKRLRNPVPEVFVTAAGLPLRFHGWQWPFHRSTSGADTFIVHGTVELADGTPSVLHAKLSVSMTVTFAELVPSVEQPYAEDFLYNAVRKTVDYGQVELLKSGNRQPIPVTMRYWSRWANKFVFTETDEAARLEFLALKLYWLSGVLGGGAPVWIADPRDAQYLNTTPEELTRLGGQLAAEGTAAGVHSLGPEYAAATPALLSREAFFRAKLGAAMEAIKPAFNEDMRAGHTNM